MSEITKTEPETRQMPQWFWLLFFALTIFVFFFGLSIPFVGPDEPRYAEVAREMFLRGDWITPTLGGFNWFEKPALLYWLEIASFYLFGVNEFAARLGPALCGLGTVFSLWLIGRRYYPRSDRANWIALVAASTIGIIVFSRGASFDIVVTFPLTASLAGFIINGRDEKPSILPLFCFYFFIGIALLAKGLIGLVFPIGIVAVYYLSALRWPEKRFLFSLLWGIPLLFAVAATWYLPMYLRHGNSFVDEFIIQQHFQRFTSNKYQHPQPFIFFFWVLPLMTIPWLPFFLVAVWKFTGALFLKTSGRKTGDEMGDDRAFNTTRLKRFAFAWLLVPLLFFSLSGSKLPGYILPAVPPALLLAAEQVQRLIRQVGSSAKFIAATAIATYVVVVCSLLFAVPRFAEDETVKYLIAAADIKGYHRLQVTGFITVSHNAEFYAAGRLVRDNDGKQHRFIGVHEIRDYIDLHGGQPLLVFSPLEHVKHLTNSDVIRVEVLEVNGELAITLVRAG